MTTNMGTVDRGIRFIVGVFLIVAPLLNLFGLGGSSVLAYVLMAVGGIFVLTSLFGMCPLYSVFGISTKS